MDPDGSSPCSQQPAHRQIASVHIFTFSLTSVLIVSSIHATHNIFIFPGKNFVHTSHLKYSCYMARPYIHLYFIIMWQWSVTFRRNCLPLKVPYLSQFRQYPLLFLCWPALLTTTLASPLTRSEYVGRKFRRNVGNTTQFHTISIQNTNMKLLLSLPPT